MSIVSCELCGKSFSVTPSLLAKGKGRFCSRECAAESRKSQRVLTCEHCGKQVPGVRAKARFCSRECAEADARMKRAVAACAHCGAPCTRQAQGKSYCSRACQEAALHRVSEPCPYASGLRIYDAWSGCDLPATSAQACPVR